MKREEAKQYVAYVVDDAGSGRRLGADPHAVIRDGNPLKRIDQPNAEPCHPSVLVGWEGKFGPVFVSVHSYLDVKLDDDEAIEMATDYLEEIGWFSDGPTEPDYVIR